MLIQREGSDMGDIGPNRAQYEVLPVPAFGLDEADTWTVGPPVIVAPGDPSAEQTRAVSRDDADR